MICILSSFFTYLNPAMSKFGIYAYLPKMRDTNDADVFAYSKSLITKQIR